MKVLKMQARVRAFPACSSCVLPRTYNASSLFRSSAHGMPRCERALLVIDCALPEAGEASPSGERGMDAERRGMPEGARDLLQGTHSFSPPACGWTCSRGYLRAPARCVRAAQRFSSSPRRFSRLKLQLPRYPATFSSCSARVSSLAPRVSLLPGRRLRRGGRVSLRVARSCSMTC